MRHQHSASPMDELEIRLKGTQRSYILRDWLTNSLHFPLANIFLEMLLEGPLEYIVRFDLYALLGASAIQSYFLGTWQYEDRPHPFWGNLIGPAVYTSVEVLVEGWEFFESPYHIAYWVFSVLIGLLQQMTLRTNGKLRDLYLLLEHFVRTNILLVTYWIFETLTSSSNQTLFTFLNDSSHVFIAIVIPLLGIIVGFAHVTANHYLRTLRRTARQLRKYSEWLFGRDLLSQAVTDSNVLALQRRERTVLFMDIRGFTGWSEQKTPEEVVSMLNNYFERAEQIWKTTKDVIKIKHTGDEIMAVCSTAKGAVEMALRLRETIQEFLTLYHLSAGIGIHSGQLVEGLIGSKEVKAYDIIGDTVNTAKRLCDRAEGGEILISQACYDNVHTFFTFLEPRRISAKGKRETLQVYPVQK